MQGGNNIDINSVGHFTQEVVKGVLQNVKTLSNDDINMLTEVAQNHEVIETIDITNAELKQYTDHGVERLESNDVSLSEVSEAVNNATKMVNDLEVQSNIRKSIPKSMSSNYIGKS